MSKQLAGVFVFILFMVPLSAAFAGQLDNLYQADIEAAADRAVWQRQALSHVLVKVSGNAAITKSAAVQAELNNASGYIKQFETVRQNNGVNRMRVLLDAGKVNQLLQNQGVPIWGDLRPQTLVWLVEQSAGNRQFVRQPEHKLNQAMQQAFNYYGLPFLLPLYDIDDLLGLTETDVWAGFWHPIIQASNRYSADVVVAATLTSEQQDDAVKYQLTWQMQQDNRTYRIEVSAGSETELMLQFAMTLAEQLSQRYASAPSAQGEITLLLDVQQLSNLADIVQVQRALIQVVGVSQATVKRYQRDTAQFAVQTNMSAEGLVNALRFNKQLQAIPADSEQPLSVDSPPVLATYRYQRL